MSLPYVDLAEELPDAPEDLVRFVAKATAQNPEDRYLDCKSIVDVLQSQKQGGTLLKDAGVQSITAICAPAHESEARELFDQLENLLNEIGVSHIVRHR